MSKVRYTYRGAAVNVSCHYPPFINGNVLSAAGAAYVDAVLAKLGAARHKAADELLDTYNDTWTDDEHPSLTSAEFQARLVEPSISILDEPDSCSVYFSDSDMFGGHKVEVFFEGIQPTGSQLLG